MNETDDPGDQLVTLLIDAVNELRAEVQTLRSVVEKVEKVEPISRAAVNTAWAYAREMVDRALYNRLPWLIFSGIGLFLLGFWVRGRW